MLKTVSGMWEVYWYTGVKERLYCISNYLPWSSLHSTDKVTLLIYNFLLATHFLCFHNPGVLFVSLLWPEFHLVIQYRCLILQPLTNGINFVCYTSWGSFMMHFLCLFQSYSLKQRSYEYSEPKTIKMKWCCSISLPIRQGNTKNKSCAEHHRDTLNTILSYDLCKR